jgi:hypothetical protein
MARVHLHLQEGFRDDPVTVLAGDDVVYTRSDVTTNLSSSLADTVTFDAASGSQVQIELPDLGLSASPTLPQAVDGDVYVTASLSSDREHLDVVTTEEEPRYM